jgi:hypothetical protein
MWRYGLCFILGLGFVVDKYGGDDEARGKLMDAGRELCIGYLRVCRSGMDPSVEEEQLKRIDDCLVTAYSEMTDSNGLYTFLHDEEMFYYDVEAVVAMLHSRGFHYAKSLVFQADGNIKEFLQVSLDVLSGVLIDASFCGDVGSVVNVFVSYREKFDTHTFWTYSKVCYIVSYI